LNKIDFLIIFALVFLLLGGFFIISYYNTNLKNDCVSNPLVFGAKQLEDRYNGLEVEGYIYNKVMGLSNINVFFNSTSITYNK
jgi:hypothetical protein